MLFSYKILSKNREVLPSTLLKGPQKKFGGPQFGYAWSTALSNPELRHKIVSIQLIVYFRSFQ
jgi:hypothetical protein